MVDQHYKDKIETQAAILKGLYKYSKLLLWAKLLSFIFLIFSVYKCVFNDFNPTWAIISAFFLVGYFVSLLVDLRIQKEIKLHESITKTLKNELSYLNSDFSPFDSGSEFVDPEHAYTFDLDIFGDCSFFHRINRTVTDLGKIKLADKMRNIVTEIPAIISRQRSLVELANLVDWRTLFIAYGSDSKVNLTNLSSQLEADSKPSFFESKLFTILVCFSTCLTISSVFLAIFDIVPHSVPTMLFLLQILMSILSSSFVSRTAFQVSGLHKGLRSYGLMINHILNQKFSTPELVGLQQVLKKDQSVDIRIAFKELNSILNRLDQRANLLVFIFLNGLGLYDLWTVRSFMKWQTKYALYMADWVDTIGEFDSLVSLATYRFNNPENCEVELESGNKPILDGVNIFHPFIAKDKVVANDFSLDQNHFAIVTGANMAGKSTFLRAVGVNYIMAVNGLSVCASHFKIAPVKLFSSMRTSDNLVKNISYFNAELIRLEHLINYCKTNTHTLIILDEILKGTNSVDKLKGSKLLLEQISKLPVSGIIATHDLELTKMDEEFSHINNYCFEIELGDDIIYTYKMGRGVAQNLNATYLLKKIIDKISLEI